MDQVTELQTILQEIDDILDAFSPPELVPERRIGEIVGYHEAFATQLERAVGLATEGLDKYPLHPALLLKRGEAHALMRAGDLSAHVEAAEADFRLALEVDGANHEAAGRLLDLLFTFSAMDDSEVADAADELAERATRVLLTLRGLQIRALGYADRQSEAQALYDRWSGMFPTDTILNNAFEDVVELHETLES